MILFRGNKNSKSTKVLRLILNSICTYSKKNYTLIFLYANILYSILNSNSNTSIVMTLKLCKLQATKRAV